MKRSKPSRVLVGLIVGLAVNLAPYVWLPISWSGDRSLATTSGAAVFLVCLCTVPFVVAGALLGRWRDLAIGLAACAAMVSLGYALGVGGENSTSALAIPAMAFWATLGVVGFGVFWERSAR